MFIANLEKIEVRMFNVKLIFTMPRYRKDGVRPDFDGLLRSVAERGGIFTTREAERFNVSRQLLSYYLSEEKIERLRRGIYRATIFPPHRYEDVLTKVLAVDERAVAGGPTNMQVQDIGNLRPDAVYVRVPDDVEPKHHPPGTVVYHSSYPLEVDTYQGVPVETIPASLSATASMKLYDPAQISEAVGAAVSTGMFNADDFVVDGDSLAANPVEVEVCFDPH